MIWKCVYMKYERIIRPTVYTGCYTEIVVSFIYKKAVLWQGNNTMPL